jgi:hypothetical protein
MKRPKNKFKNDFVKRKQIKSHLLGSPHFYVFNEDKLDKHLTRCYCYMDQLEKKER